MAITFTVDQFQQLITTLTSKSSGSLAFCSSSYDGTRNSEAVETFLSTTNDYIKVHNISDRETLSGIHYLLRKEAGVWWQGVKDSVKSWSDFENYLRNTFAPKKPAYVIYQEIMTEKQPPNMLTENFIASKRSLFAQLPKPEPSETQQIDMIFGQLNSSILEKISRETISSFDDLLEIARKVEKAIEISNKLEYYHSTRTTLKRKKVEQRKRDKYCRISEHTSEQGRRRVKRRRACSSCRSEITENTGVKILEILQRSYLSKSAPKITCYGCGAPGITRSRCTNCQRRPWPVSTAEIGFCAIDVNIIP